MLYGKEYFYPFFAGHVRQIGQMPLVLDLGTTHRFRKELQPFRDDFKGRYYALDYGARAEFGPDNVNVDGDIQRLPFRSGSVDAVLCIDCLAHVPRPQEAVREIHRVLKPGGVCLAKVASMTPYHCRPGYYSDFFHFTRDGVKVLFEPFSEVTQQPCGGVPYVFFYWLCPMPLRALVMAPPFRQLFEWLDRKSSGNVTFQLMVLAVK